ncbi:MAG: hypothetical protein ABI906_10895 [Pseudomonadota bacterium]
MINARFFAIAAGAGLLTGCGLSQGPASQAPADSNPKAADGGILDRVTGTVNPARIPSDGRKFMLTYGTVTCASPIALGVARTIWPHALGSDYQGQVFNATHCLPPGGGLTLPTPVPAQYFQDVTWRATFDGGVSWIGGALRVAALRGKAPGGEDVTTFVAIDDLIPMGPARASASKPGV